MTTLNEVNSRKIFFRHVTYRRRYILFVNRLYPKFTRVTPQEAGVSREVRARAFRQTFRQRKKSDSARPFPCRDQTDRFLSPARVRRTNSKYGVWNASQNNNHTHTHTHTRVDGGAMWHRHVCAAAAAVFSSRFVSFFFLCFSFRRATRMRRATRRRPTYGLRDSAEVSLKEHSSSCAQSNTRPQSGRKKYLRPSCSVAVPFSRSPHL